MPPQTRKRKPPPRRDNDDASWDASSSEPEFHPPERRRKRPRQSRNADANVRNRWREILVGILPEDPESCLHPLQRHPHSLAYHRPLLLAGDGRRSRDALLAWFDSVSSARGMPWRKPWIDPDSKDPEELRRVLGRRAYEVWISEVMLQQTRVATAAGYWERWMARWPTMEALAEAKADEVLAAWRGLGYYGRAARVLEAAKLVVGDPEMQGLLPASAVELETRVPGVGRYTAGALSAIVFGHAAAMVDGNVLRVLSRQMGLLADVKSRAAVDAIWAAAESLVQAVAGKKLSEDDGDDIPPSDRPGRWGQALMELGSTVCTPKPNCGECPVTSTCRAYGEGQLVSSDEAKQPGDIEDACQLCEPVELEAVDTAVEHVKRFPVKTAKKATREEECVVCAIRRSDGRYLIRRRPSKGLLAGMWEFPSEDLGNTEGKKEGKKATLDRTRVAESFAAGLDDSQLRHEGELGSVPWQFSHLKLTMHVHLFLADERRGRAVKNSRPAKNSLPSRWATADEIEDESMGTGMRKCWTLVREA